jgi:hypothetical protein
MTKIAGSGSISQRHGSAESEPDSYPHQNVIDPENWLFSMACYSSIECRLSSVVCSIAQRVQCIAQWVQRSSKKDVKKLSRVQGSSVR